MFELNEERRLIINTVRKISQEVLKPRAVEIDKTGEFPWDTAKLFAENGILTPLLPKKYGGIEAGHFTFSMILEEISKVCAASALILIAQADGLVPILIDGSEELKDRFLHRVADESLLLAFGATEPGAGSDVLSLRTRAVRDGDYFIINGQKCFITDGCVADIIALYAYTDPEKKAKGMSVFVVEKGTEGLIYGKNEDKMGMRGGVNSELFLENMKIPAKNLIGKEGNGFANMMKSLDSSRLFSASQAAGLSQGAIDEAVNYSKVRVQFGSPISKIQAIQFMIADMVAATEAARLLTYQTAVHLDKESSEATKFAAIAKIFASDTAMKVTTDAVQVMGGYGYMKDYPVERMMRDAKLIQIYTGTNQILRVVAGRAILK